MVFASLCREMDLLKHEVRMSYNHGKLLKQFFTEAEKAAKALLFVEMGWANMVYGLNGGGGGGGEGQHLSPDLVI